MQPPYSAQLNLLEKSISRRISIWTFFCLNYDIPLITITAKIDGIEYSGDSKKELMAGKPSTFQNTLKNRINIQQPIRVRRFIKIQNNNRKIEI